MGMCLLRHKMQHFVSMLEQYTYSEVIDKSWTFVQGKVAAAAGYADLVSVRVATGKWIGTQGVPEQDTGEVLPVQVDDEDTCAADRDV